MEFISGPTIEQQKTWAFDPVISQQKNGNRIMRQITLHKMDVYTAGSSNHWPVLCATRFGRLPSLVMILDISCLERNRSCFQGTILFIVSLRHRGNMAKDSVLVLVNMQRVSVVVPSFLLFLHSCALHGLPFLVTDVSLHWTLATGTGRTPMLADVLPLRNQRLFSRHVCSPANARNIQLEKGRASCNDLGPANSNSLIA